MSLGGVQLLNFASLAPLGINDPARHHLDIWGAKEQTIVPSATPWLSGRR